MPEPVESERRTISRDGFHIDPLFSNCMGFFLLDPRQLNLGRLHQISEWCTIGLSRQCHRSISWWHTVLFYISFACTVDAADAHVQHENHLDFLWIISYSSSKWHFLLKHSFLLLTALLDAIRNYYFCDTTMKVLAISGFWSKFCILGIIWDDTKYRKRLTWCFLNEKV